MADYYSGSPLPTPAPGTLPYPWITQFDPSHQTTFYVNVETQESTWTLPDLNSLSTSQHASMDGGIRAMPNNYHGGGAAGDSYPPATYQHPGDSARGSGEASSFYASSGTVPQSPGKSTHADQAQIQYDENGQPIQGDGERGLGKVIVGGGAMYLAYKLYKDYQKGKLNQQQFKPPNPSNATPQTRPTNGSYPYVQHPQSHFGPPKRDNVAPTPNWDQKPYSAYGGPPPGPYVAGGNYQSNPSYPQQGSPNVPGPSMNYSGATYSQPPQYDASQYTSATSQGFSVGHGQPTQSAWGDPRHQ